MDQWPVFYVTDVHKEKIGQIQNIVLMVEKEDCVSKIDVYVKHIFREHNQEADYWANLGAEGQRKIYC